MAEYDLVVIASTL